MRGTSDPRPVDLETRFMIGSVTKSMTSLLMASLADDGLLDWDARVIDTFPEFALSDPASTPLIRVRDLVNHSSGVPQLDVPILIEAMPPSRLIASIQRIPVQAAPGQVFGYSNQMYATGGFLAAALAGAPVDDAGLANGFASELGARVFEPIGMPRTTLDFDAAIADDDHALPHGYNPMSDAVEATLLERERFVVPVAPAGAAWSNITDMAHYAITQFDGVSPSAARIVSRENLAETHTPQISIAEGVGYAMGWVVQDDGMGERRLWHNGGTTGFTADVLLLPERSAGVVVLTNAANAEAFYEAVNRYVIESLTGSEHADDADLVASADALREALRELASQMTSVDATLAEPLVGRYDHHVDVTLDDDRLVLNTDFGPYSLLATGTPGAYLSAGVTTGVAAAQYGPDAAGIPGLVVGTPGTDGIDQAITLKRIDE